MAGAHEDNGIYYERRSHCYNQQRKKNFRLLMISLGCFFSSLCLFHKCSVGTESIESHLWLSYALKLCNSFHPFVAFTFCVDFLRCRFEWYFFILILQNVFHWMLMKMNLGNRAQQWAMFFSHSQLNLKIYAMNAFRIKINTGWKCI